MYGFFLLSESDTNHIIECFTGCDLIRHCWCDYYPLEICSACRDSPYIFIGNLDYFM